MTKLTIKNKLGEVLKELEVTSNATLLKQLEAAQVEIPNACRMGMCAACMCHIEQGIELVKKDFRGEPAFPLGEDEVMTCIASVIDSEDQLVLRTMY